MRSVIIFFMLFFVVIFIPAFVLNFMPNSIQEDKKDIQKSNVEKIDITKDEFKLLQNGYSWEDQEINGMQYRVFFARPTGAYASKAIFIINITKDKLEVDTLKSNLNIP